MLPQVVALQILHGEEGTAVLFADVVDGADIGVIEDGGGSRLPLKTVARLGIESRFVRQKLKRRRTLQPCVLGGVDYTHTPASQPAEDPVVRDGAADDRVVACERVTGLRHAYS